MFSTSLRLTLARPEDALGLLCSHLAEHEAVVTRLDDRTRISLGKSEAWLTVRDETVDIVIEAPGLAELKEMKWAIASHLAEFAPPGATTGLRWSGDASGPSLPPDFRVLTVIGTEQITPHMRRIRFRGEDLARFDTMEALHVRLFIPPAGLADPAWPLLGDDGILRQPPPERRPAIRKYTIREIDAAAGTLAIDFVVHDDAGPGSAFALRAGTGDVLGMAGPGGRGLKQADRYLFLADETGLPAVARMLESLPRTARGLAIIEIADPGEQQPLDAPDGVAIRWLHRDGAAPGGATLLPDAFAALDWPPEGERLYLWAALEYAAFRQIRSAARERLRPGQDEHLIVSYWRSGMAEEQHAAQKKLAAGAT
ncbi:DUF2218 domain-containing protein [Bosea sp. (in: a-proteobacteria)]|jgi:NADPH-dependent ferric siderophore reductase|uniref:DUF2218 domain-containing protein n=1 Tax=Bosea sp. (in: a-proteobacteria) TaxID=1871050 RepID=UPI003F6FF7A8